MKPNRKSDQVKIAISSTLSQNYDVDNVCIAFNNTMNISILKDECYISVFKELFGFQILYKY